MGRTCFCIVMQQYRILGLESLGGATVNRVGVISGRFPVFWTASGLTCWDHFYLSSEPLHSYWVRLVLSCFCILLEQYRFLDLEPLRGATVGRLEVISSRLGVFFGPRWG